MVEKRHQKTIEMHSQKRNNRPQNAVLISNRLCCQQFSVRFSQTGARVYVRKQTAYLKKKSKPNETDERVTNWRKRTISGMQHNGEFSRNQQGMPRPTVGVGKTAKHPVTPGRSHQRPERNHNGKLCVWSVSVVPLVDCMVCVCMHCSLPFAATKQASKQASKLVD